MTQGTGYIYSQRGDVVLGKRTGTTRNQPSNYKPFKILKGVDTVITFFIRDVNGCKIQLHDKTIKAVVMKHDGHHVLVQKNLRVQDVKNGVATLHLSPGDIANMGPGFYEILLTWKDELNRVHALHSDANYRYCYVAEVVNDCGPMHMDAQSAYSDYVLGLQDPDDTIYPLGITGNDWAIVATAPLGSDPVSTGSPGGGDITFSPMVGVNLNVALGLSSGCGAVFNISIGISFIINGNFVYDVTFVSTGAGYQVGDVILVTGDQLGGVRGVNDLRIQVDSVDPTGAIQTYTVTGTPYTDVHTIVTEPFEGPASTVANCGGINTFSVTYAGGATGTVQMQATLSPNPTSDADWFDVPQVCGYNKEINVSNKTGTEAYQTDGMFMFVRFKFTLTIGRVDKIHYRR